MRWAYRRRVFQDVRSAVRQRNKVMDLNEEFSFLSAELLQPSTSHFDNYRKGEARLQQKCCPKTLFPALSP